MNKEYHKIETLFERDVNGTKKLIEGKFRNKYIEYFANCEWIFTEKVDGTNIRIYWDGHKVSFHGRTDKAQLPVNLVNRLTELFGGVENEELFEQRFGEKEVILYGEGYGAGIQKVGKDYLDHQDFILFDVMVNGFWLSQDNVEAIAQAFNIKTAPVILEGTITDGVNYVKQKPKSTMGECVMEGVVGRPKLPLYDGYGHRIIVKIKECDFI